MRSHLRMLLIVAVTGLLVLAAVAGAQDTIILNTPTAVAPATSAPAVDRSPLVPPNPGAGDVPTLGPSFSVNPANLDGYIVTNNPGPMFMREGDNISFRPVAVVTGGVSLEATGTNEEQTWWRVRTAGGGFEGWINAELLTLRGDLTEVPVIPESQKGRMLMATFAVFVEQPLYRSASEESRVLCNVRPGEYIIVSIDEGREFFRIRATCTGGRNVAGYININNGAFRNASGDPVTIAPAPPIRRSAPAVAPAATQVPGSSSSTSSSGVIVVTSAAPAVSGGIGPSFRTFITQTVYSEDRALPSRAVCQMPAGLYSIVARSNGNDFYLIMATCADGRTVEAWISFENGAFQNETTRAVAIAVTATPDTGPSVNLGPNAVRFVTFITQPVFAAPADNARTVCNIVAAEHRITGQTGGGEFYRLATVCADGRRVTAWIPAEAGAFRNPAQADVPVIQ
ncbi:MAG: hypothetical protein AAFR56_03020 [Chloroflexota bacterium]